MKVSANWQLPVYQVIGPVVRVHWDYSVREVMDELGEGPMTVHEAQEAVVPLDADRQTFVRLVDEAGGDGEALADGWFPEMTP
jgi:hypothetical protein